MSKDFRGNNYRTDKKRSKLDSNLESCGLYDYTFGQKKRKYCWQYFTGSILLVKWRNIKVELCSIRARCDETWGLPDSLSRSQALQPAKRGWHLSPVDIFAWRVKCRPRKLRAQDALSARRLADRLGTDIFYVTSHRPLFRAASAAVYINANFQMSLRKILGKMHPSQPPSDWFHGFGLFDGV